MYNRCQLGNMAANNQLYAHRLARPFENKPSRQTDYNLFIHANYGQNPIFLTQGQVISGACVLAPYQFTHGSLPCIDYAVNTEGVLVSNLALGSLVITELTTVAAFSQALINNNEDWREGDELIFFHAVQSIDAYLNVPRARMNSSHLVLDTTDTELLFNIVSAVGFASVNENDDENKLGMNTSLVNAGAAWVHSRKRADSSIRVSTQWLYVVSDLCAEYQTEEALATAAESYGVIRTEIL